MFKKRFIRRMGEFVGRTDTICHHIKKDYNSVVLFSLIPNETFLTELIYDGVPPPYDACGF